MTVAPPDLKRHPLSNTYRVASNGEMEEFVESVRNNGVRPIVLFEGQVLDGWHRYLASFRAYVECPCTEFEGTTWKEAAAYVNSQNHHIHTKSEIAEAVVRQKRIMADHEGRPAYKDKTGDNLDGANLARTEDVSTDTEVTPSAKEFDEEVAEEAGVSHRTAQRARRRVEVDEDLAERINQCIQTAPDTDLGRQMRAEAEKVQAGELAAADFLGRWEDREQQPAPKRQTRTRTERPKSKTSAEKLREAKDENEALRETLSIKEGEILALQERTAEMERNERVLLSEKKGEAGIMQCYQEVSNIRAEMVSLRTSLEACKRGREDQRRRAEAYKKQLRKHGIDVRDPETWK